MTYKTHTIKDNGIKRQEKGMEQAFKYGQMDQSLKEIGDVIKHMEEDV